MNVDAQKLELIEWILKLRDAAAIREILKIKEIASHRKPQTNTRKFGCGKHIFTHVADDFDEPLEDFSKGVRGKYAKRYAEGNNIVLLSPDVAEYFPDSQSVNRALRLLIDIAAQKKSPNHGRSGPASANAL